MVAQVRLVEVVLSLFPSVHRESIRRAVISALREMPISFVPYTAVYGPLSVGSTCSLWFDAADINSIILSGSSVLQWNDKSGNGRHMSNASGGATYTPNGLTFSGTTVLSNSSGFNSTVGANLFVVWSSTTATTRQRFIAIQYNGGLIGAYFDTTFIDIHYNLSTGYYYGPIAYSTGTSYIYTATTGSGPLLSYSINGTNSTSWTAPETGNAYLSTGNAIGGQGGLTFNGNIMEVIYFDAFMTTPQRQAIEGYLAQKWGLTANLPAGHPGLTQTLYNGKVYQPQISLKPAPYANYYPLSIGGCALWLDAADATTIVTGTGVSQWRDKSGSSNNATQATGSQQPTYTAGTKVAFNKSNSQYMSLPNGTIPFGNSEYSFYLVLTPQSTGIDVVFSSGDYSTTGGTNGLYYNTSLYQNYWFYQDANLNVSPVIAQRALIEIIYTQNVNRYMYSAGTLQSTTASSNRNSFSTNNIIGAEGPYPGRGYYSSVDFHEFIIYNTGHMTNQRQQIEGYLAWKWGITLPITHPYYSAPPVQYTRGAILPPPTLNATGNESYANTAYYNVSPQAWNYNWRPYLQSLAAANSRGVTLTTSIYSNSATNAVSAGGGYPLGGTLAPNGCIYTPPFYINPYILKYNTITGVASLINQTLSGSTFYWAGSVLAPNGKIYCVPIQTPNVLVIDTTNDTTTQIATGQTGFPNSGGCLAPNGKIYCFPYQGTSILVINPSNDTTYTIPSGGITFGNNYWGPGCLGPNGKIYCARSVGTTILVIDTNNDSLSTLDAGSSGGGAVLAANGNIYFGGEVMLNPATGIISNISGGSSIGIASLGADGKILCGVNSSNIIQLDTVTDTYVTTVTSTSFATSGWSSPILCPNGNIYYMPTTSSNILIINYSGLSQLPSSNFCLSPFSKHQ